MTFAGVRMGAGADLLGHVADTKVPKGSIPRWGELFGYGVRQIKNWLALGREKGDMPPFEDPVALLEWAGRHLERVPGRLQEAVDALTGQKSEAREETPAAAETFELPDISNDELSVEADLQRFRRSLAIAHRMHDQSLEKGDTLKARQFMDQAREISAEVRQLEKLLPQMRAESGDWMLQAEVKRELMDLLNVLYRALLGRAPKAAGRIREATSDAELQQIWRAEMQEVFADCSRSGFAEGFELGS